LSISSLAQPGNSDGPQGPKCVYRDLDSNKIIHYNCDRFQSKGDIDTVTPQIKIVEPEHEDVIDYSALPINPSNGNRRLPITIVVSPEDDYTVDFTAASNAGTQYAMLPQVDGLGHAHAYVAPEIEVTKNPDGSIASVTFVGAENRADFVGGFCVFQAPVTQTPDYQVLTVNCDLQQTQQPIVNGSNYRVIVDTTQNSHDSRTKHHPRANPPGDHVVIQFMNVPVAP
jgi:hypothetical protein